MKNPSIRFLLAFLSALAMDASAGPLTEAKVTKIINHVQIIDPRAGSTHPASLEEVIKDEIGLQTGIKSRSELKFQDETLTRIGPETYFSFKTGTREMTLQRGTLLLQVPKGLGGAKIHTAAVTASITGTTILMEHIPGRDIKILVLEGSLRLSVNGRFGDSLLLLPGRMVIMNPSAKRIPDPVTVDLRKVVQTSTLVNMKDGKKKGAKEKPLPSMALIEQAADRQQQGKDAHSLIDTNLVIDGKGTNVLLASDDFMSDLALRNDVEKIRALSIPVPQATPVATPNPTPNPAPTPNPNPPPSGTPTPPPPVGYVTDNTTTIVTTGNVAPTISTQGVTTSGVLYKDLVTNGSPSAFLFGATSTFDNSLNFDNVYLQQFKPSAVFVFDSLQLGGMTFQTHDGINSITLIGNGGISNAPGTTIDLGGISDLFVATQVGSITLDSGISFTSSQDAHPSVVGFYARGGDVQTGSTFNLPNSDLQFSAENNVNFTASAAVTVKNLDVTGLQSVQFDGNANIAQVFQLDGGTVEMGGTVTTHNAFVYGSSATINGSLSSQGMTAVVTGDFLLNPSGSIITTNPADTSITAGGNLTLNGTVSSHKVFLTATGALTLGGTITAADQMIATSGTATVNGTLNLQAADFETSGDFVLSGTGASTTTQNTIIHANGGGITLNGALAGNNVTLNATGDIAIDHAISSTLLTVIGKSVAFGTDLTVTGSNNDLTATNGNIDATGHQLSGFDQVSVTNGNFMAGGLSANTLIVNQSGSVNVANNLNLRNAFTSSGAITVGGLLTTPTITAANITTNAVHTNAIISSGVFTLGSSDLAPLSSNTITVTAPTIALLAGVTMDGQGGTPSTGPGNALNLTITTGAFNLGAGLSLNGGDGNAARNDAGGNGGQLNLTSSDSITLNAPISATTGQNSHSGVNGGNGGTVNLTAANTIALNDRIEVSSNTGSRRSNGAGNINVTSNKTSGTAIAVSSSAQLLALLNSTTGGGGGSIKFVSAGGDINVDTATMQADRGTIDIRNNGAAGVVAINNATLNASTIKVGALGNNGTLNVGGGNISADSIIHLYAGGSNGTVNFTESVTLNGTSAKTIAGDTVTIFNGKMVTINGPAAADVFTNHPNYTGFGGNGSTTGTFGGQGAVTHPLIGAPGF